MKMINIMRNFLLKLLLFLCPFTSMSQPYAQFLQHKDNLWDTICVLGQEELHISTDGEISFQNHSCLPLPFSSSCFLNFVFPDHSYFLIEIKNIFTSRYCSYPSVQFYCDSIKPTKYKVDLPHAHDTIFWKSFAKKWNCETADSIFIGKPFLKIDTSYVVYGSDTVNVYDNAHRKDGKWLVYSINNVFRKDSTTFFLPFDLTILVEQYFEHGKRVGVWTGYYRDGKKNFTCVFENDSLVKGSFFKIDGKIRYKYLYFEKDSFVLKDYTNKRKKIHVSQETMLKWLQL